jgi:hypothetical protein
MYIYVKNISICINVSNADADLKQTFVILVLRAILELDEIQPSQLCFAFARVEVN